MLFRPCAVSPGARRTSHLLCLAIARAGAVGLALVTTGCPGSGNNDDADYDGWIDEEDCNPTDRETYPGAEDPYGDGIDQDCDGADGVDKDADGYPENVALDLVYGDLWDCDDTDPEIHPGVPDSVGNEVDENCDGTDGIDEDGDGYASPESGGDDCDESDYWTHPGASDAVGDNIDQNCDDIDGIDADGDGFASQDSLGTDCDDDNPSTHPGALDPCDGIDNNCETNPEEVDEDGDGYFLCSGDCDDNDASAYPGALEECDGVDHDCDGNIPGADDDNDGDGIALCAGDCNDNNGAVHPGATEVCNGQDDDCDGQVPSSEGDSDGDGWVGCGADCNDSDAEVFPGQWLETPGDGLDSDCDGSDGAPALAGASVIFEGNSGANVFGGAVAAAGDIDGDGLDDLLVAAPGSNTLGGASYPAGRVLVFTGAQLSVLSSEPLGLDEAYAVLEGEQPFDFAGTALAGVGDVDGDGRDDLAIGAFGNDDAGQNAGKVYLVMGISLAGGGTFDLGDASTSQHTWTGEMPGDELGISVAAAGDVDGDNLHDFLVGAHNASPGGAYSGRAYLVLGASLGTSGMHPASSIPYRFDGEGDGEFAGTSVAGAGDVDGDGLDDIVVGAPAADGQADGSGRVYLWKGSRITTGGSGSFDLGGADLIVEGTADNEQLGEVVALADDIDGDGRSELLVGSLSSAGGSSGTAGDGRLSLFLSTTMATSGTVARTSATHTFDGAIPGPGTQNSDVDGDGQADLLLGYPGLGSAGGVALFLGAGLGASGSHSESSADFAWDGRTADDDAGFRCAGVGDIDGDGRDDLVVGTHRDGTSATPGEAYLLLSPL